MCSEQQSVGNFVTTALKPLSKVILNGPRGCGCFYSTRSSEGWIRVVYCRTHVGSPVLTLMLLLLILLEGLTTAKICNLLILIIFLATPQAYFTLRPKQTLCLGYMRQRRARNRGLLGNWSLHSTLTKETRPNTILTSRTLKSN